MMWPGQISENFIKAELDSKHILTTGQSSEGTI